MRVAAVVPCFRVRNHIDTVLDGLAGRVDHVYVVDDACPEQTGKHVRTTRDRGFVTVIEHETNQGVGGAVISGYQHAAADGCEILVKVDGDGQMDPAYLPALIAPIAEGRADYAKGNRFFDLRTLSSMPTLRLIGNSALSLVNKLASGYWEIMDPTNGFTAIHAAVLRCLPLQQIDRRYFFESDMLFRLGCVRAKVVDVPMPARYGDEVSNLRVRRVAGEFPGKYLQRFLKRIAYNYLLRGFNAGTVLLMAGLPLLAFGVGYGIWHWWLARASGVPASSGVVMLAALPTIVGTQCLLSFLSIDVGSAPREPIWMDVAALPDAGSLAGAS